MVKMHSVPEGLGWKRPWRSSKEEGAQADCKDAKKVQGWEAGWNEASAWTRRHLLLPPVP